MLWLTASARRSRVSLCTAISRSEVCGRGLPSAGCPHPCAATSLLGQPGGNFRVAHDSGAIRDLAAPYTRPDVVTHNPVSRTASNTRTKLEVGEGDASCVPPQTPETFQLQRVPSFWPLQAPCAGHLRGSATVLLSPTIKSRQATGLERRQRTGQSTSSP